MIRRAQPADVAQDIADCIVASLRESLWRVVLFGSRARGDAQAESDWDVYVEVDAAREALKQLRDRAQHSCGGSTLGASIDLKVHLRGEIERRRDDPGTIEWDVAREGRVLYANPAAPTILKPPTRVAEPPAEPPASLHEWLEAAERDLRLARKLRDWNEDYWPQICWHSQQTCEKHLKALIVSRHERPERTHDLTALLLAARAAGCVLPDISDDCTELTKHAITPRYPAGNDLGPDDARTALDRAERVVAAVRLALPPQIH